MRGGAVHVTPWWARAGCSAAYSAAATRKTQGGSDLAAAPCIPHLFPQQ